MDQDRDVAQPQLTIGDLAERTGLSPAVLRMWETRHGFPEPQRIASGHRRYTEADVDLVKQVLRRKEAGIRLEVAIAEASATQAPSSPSIFAELRRRHPTLVTHRLRKSTLIALSWAIEDECCAVAESPVLFGAFQRGDFYGPSAARWTELSRVARSAIVFADHWGGTADEAEGPIRATLAEDAPMRREWAVVCDAFDSTAALSAWELPGQSEVPDRQRLFEAVWTVDPVAVRDAARVGANVAASAGVLAAQPLLYELADPPTPRSTTPTGVTALFNRVVAYVDRLT
ncbi:DICT sensory domain-containing protein [Nocardioides marmorisolisilvae]|uniref:MerR family transcriptional regulator n=1 Tax=Nocardioides marmorisolisilvae TaxID=1542737 RepID=A0A3N0DX16_9ACTN|nr:DICT sensory domain-containing protein [Nocardioides marmorisolisilvae]RNL80162.1 MerR family transcriptional regulator [Nocardioides marmorisolisilvae]